MKIKSDFVTNSSSTSYVVFIPDKFYPDEDEIMHIFKSEVEIYYDPPDDEVTIEERLYKDLPDYIETLKEGDNLWREGTLGFAVFDVILNMCEKHGFVLAQMEISCEGNNVIYGVSEQVIETIMFNNLDLMSTFNQIQKRGKDVTTKTE